MFCHFQDVEGQNLSSGGQRHLGLICCFRNSFLKDLNPAYSPFVFGETRGWNGFWNHPLILKMGVQVDSGQEGCLGWMDQMDESEKTMQVPSEPTQPCLIHQGRHNMQTSKDLHN